MIWLLDTNTCVQYLNGRSTAVREKLQPAAGNVALCSIVKAELLCGVLRTRDPERSSSLLREFFAGFPSVPFDDRCAESYAHIRTRLAQSGTPIGPNDLLIAAIAVSYGLILVTHNTREFGRVDGLRLEDWEV